MKDIFNFLDKDDIFSYPLMLSLIFPSHLALIKNLHSEPLKWFALTCISNFSWLYWFLFYIYIYIYINMLISVFFFLNLTLIVHIHTSVPSHLAFAQVSGLKLPPMSFFYPYYPQSSIGCDSADHQCLIIWSFLDFLQSLIYIFLLLTTFHNQAKQEASSLHIWSSNNSSPNPSTLQTQIYNFFLDASTHITHLCSKWPYWNQISHLP